MAWNDDAVHAFLSHNSHDKEVARRLGAQLRLAGANVWLDEWEVRAGDSLVGKVDEALAVVDTIVLIWSRNAERSDWVRAEFESAIARSIDSQTCRVVPLRLDDTPLPSLLRRLKWIDLQQTEIDRAVDEIMGFANDRDRLRAIQETLDEASIEIRDVPGYGPVVCCPNCGAGLDSLEGWSDLDPERDDTYAGFRCRECGFNDGGEI